MKSASLSFLLLILATQGASAESGRQFPLEKACTSAEALKPLDPQGVFTYAVVAVPARGGTQLPADLELELHRGDTSTPLALDARHGFVPPCSDRKNVTIHVNYPKNTVGFLDDYRPRLPAGTHMRYAELAESAPIMERGIRAKAGLLRFMAPKVSGFILGFDPGNGQTVTVALPTGPKTFTADAKGVIRLPWQPGWVDAMVTLSEPLHDFDIEIQ